jgi:hypothetical protein
LLSRVVWAKFAGVSEVLDTSNINAPMMEAARTSETLVNFDQTTRRNNPENSHLQAHNVFIAYDST